MRLGGQWMDKWKVEYIKKAVRLRKRLTNKQLAKRLEVSVTAVNYHSGNYHSGKSRRRDCSRPL